MSINLASSGLSAGLPARWPQIDGIGRNSARGICATSRRVLASTVLEDAVATQDTVIQLIAAIRRVGREVPGAAEAIAAVCSAHDYADPGKPAIAWDDQLARAELSTP